MTTVKDNFMTTGLSGMYDDKVVFRQWKGRTIFTRPPRKSERHTPLQERQKEKFRSAVDYAKVAMLDPVKQEFYRKAANGEVSAFNMAVADFLSLPKVVRIETDEYTGEPGCLLSVVATDKGKVTSVKVRITDSADMLIEEGHAVNIADSRMWLYTVTAHNPTLPGTTITALVTGLPGNEGKGSVTL